MTEHRTAAGDSASSLGAIPWRGEQISRVILGTVQLGLDYGIANTQGQPDTENALAIIETAWEGGIRHFDTAQSYGDSEAVLGDALAALGVSGEAHLASKLSVELDPANVSGVETAIEATFKKLRVERLWCMLFHRAHFLDHWDHGLGDLLLRLRKEGRIEHLGVSLASPEEAKRCLDHPHVEVLQAACNAWDYRMPRLGVFGAAARNGQLVCVRSVYLQGLLTLPVETAAQRLPVARDAAIRWHTLAAEFGIAPKELAVRFALGLDRPLVIGAESPGQVRETLSLARMEPLPQAVLERLRAYLDPVVHERILDPRWWTKC